jgi:hypothetical protein
MPTGNATMIRPRKIVQVASMRPIGVIGTTSP